MNVDVAPSRHHEPLRISNPAKVALATGSAFGLVACATARRASSTA